MSKKLEQHRGIDAIIAQDVKKIFSTIAKAKKKGVDPQDNIATKIANKTGERVLGLLAQYKVEISTKSVLDSLEKLEHRYGKQHWLVACHIALQIAQQEHGVFQDSHQAIEYAIRFGFSYITMGVVSSPIEGFTSLHIVDNKFHLHFAGPIRNAGGTAASVCVLIADFLRSHMGYEPYQASPDEVRYVAKEVVSYHNFVTNLQYTPSQEELEHTIRSIPVAIRGNPTEQREVGDVKPFDTSIPKRIRGGVCLLFAECLCAKSAKLYKQISRWEPKEKMEHWLFLQKTIAYQQNKQNNIERASVTDKFMSEVVGGRPVFGGAFVRGGFRVRYGRSRTNGYSAQSIHPASMVLLDEYIATGTQLRTQTPGKACTITPCESIEGPIVLLGDGTVVQIQSEQKARQIKQHVDKILYLGDILINYGDFLDRAADLVPAGYCEEWWSQECEASGAEIVHPQNYHEAQKISQEYNIPLHPKYTFFYACISAKEMRELHKAFEKHHSFAHTSQTKEALQTLGVPHQVTTKELKIDDTTQEIFTNLFKEAPITSTVGSGLDYVNKITPYHIRDKAGTFVGARMGRPEKAKSRSLSIHGIFPQNVSETQTYIHNNQKISGKDFNAWRKEYLHNHSAKKIKGFKSFETQNNVIEYLGKGHIRSEHGIGVNKDGTMRYDATQVPLTHFIPEEIGLSLDMCKSLGYTHDAQGNPITTTNQLIALHPQDIILPDELGEDADIVESAYKHFFTSMRCVDDMLKYIYERRRLHNVQNKKDCIGQYIVGLAPHTSCGVVGRIIGFCKQQVLYAHPFFHAAMRRDCDGDEASILLLSDALLNYSPTYLSSRRGSNMDAPIVLMSIIDPQDVDDMVFNIDNTQKYPLAFYNNTLEGKKAWEVQVPIIQDSLEQGVEQIHFTHSQSNINQGVHVSRYKKNGTMQQKVQEQMILSTKIEAVNQDVVAAKLLSSHFIRDIMGNLSKYYVQKFRDTQTGKHMRRPPISKKSNIVATLSFGSVQKYDQIATHLIQQYKTGPYITSVVELLHWKLNHQPQFLQIEQNESQQLV